MINEKLRSCFDEMVVYKDLKKSNFFNALSLPSFMRDWILKKFEDEEGNFDTEQVTEFVKKYLPKKEDWNSIKNRVVIEQERVKFLAKVSVDIDIKKVRYLLHCLILDSHTRIQLLKIRCGKSVKKIL